MLSKVAPAMKLLQVCIFPRSPVCHLPRMIALPPHTAPPLEGYCMEMNGRLGTFFCSCSSWSHFWLSDRNPADGGDLWFLTASFIITRMELSTHSLSVGGCSTAFWMVLFKLTHLCVFQMFPHSISLLVLKLDVKLKASLLIPYFLFSCLWSPLHTLTPSLLFRDARRTWTYSLSSTLLPYFSPESNYWRGLNQQSEGDGPRGFQGANEALDWLAVQGADKWGLTVSSPPVLSRAFKCPRKNRDLAD